MKLLVNWHKSKGVGGEPIAASHSLLKGEMNMITDDDPDINDQVAILFTL